jgi:hypothetical protein
MAIAANAAEGRSLAAAASGLEIIMKEYGDLAKSGNFWALYWNRFGTA